MIPKEMRLKEVKKRIEETTRQLYGVMVDLGALNGSTGPAREILQNELRRLDSVIAGLTQERDRLVEEIDSSHLNEDDIAMIENMAETVRFRLSEDPLFEQSVIFSDC